MRPAASDRNEAEKLPHADPPPLRNEECGREDIRKERERKKKKELGAQRLSFEELASGRIAK